ncbi:uncharacterized protein LOC122254143 isoform X1 [Penaeus japonicus]|uniref:uncharacterized protein LOC122254143 isoform X1 n=1 Tax=Penaeus japonicus TaxID=27405 RepID=UPI001C713D6C|nr:uncharacterized protein LOC122254143 isoform X1 [Penaeus japonicus]
MSSLQVVLVVVALIAFVSVALTLPGYRGYDRPSYHLITRLITRRIRFTQLLRLTRVLRIQATRLLVPRIQTTLVRQLPSTRDRERF